jgi:autophagy-related protein 17
MSSSPASRSQASVSPAASQSHSTTNADIPLETLVSHLLASKRSLSSISTVWRANEIVTSARAALEESVILSARTMFLRNGISEQVKILRKVRGGIETVYKEGQRDFKVCGFVLVEVGKMLTLVAERNSNSRRGEFKA